MGLRWRALAFGLLLLAAGSTSAVVPLAMWLPLGTLIAAPLWVASYLLLRSTNRHHYRQAAAGSIAVICVLALVWTTSALIAT